MVDAEGFLVNPTPIEAVEIEDEYSMMAAQIASETQARRTLKHHPLVVTYGFLVVDILDQTPEVLQGVVEASELARALGSNETCKVLGVENVGQSLPGLCRQVGMTRFVGASVALKARIEKIENKKKEEEKKKMHSSIPKRAAATPTPRQIPAAPTKKPEGSDSMGRIQLPDGSLGYTCACGCGTSMTPEYARVPSIDDMKYRQGGGHVCVGDLWRHAFNPACVRGERMFSLLVNRARMEAYDAETARLQAAYRAEQARMEAERNLCEQVRLERDARHRGSIFKETPIMRRGKTACDAEKKSGRRAA